MSHQIAFFSLFAFSEKRAFLSRCVLSWIIRQRGPSCPARSPLLTEDVYPITAINHKTISLSAKRSKNQILDDRSSLLEETLTLSLAFVASHASRFDEILRHEG